MKKYISRLVLMVTALAMFFIPTLNEVAANSEPNEFIIVHTNDMHGQMDPAVKELAYLKAYADEVDALAIFDAGDASQGLPLNNISKGARMGEIMEAIGFDAMAIGNHEFDYNQETVLGLQDGFFRSSQSLPKLGTNVYFKAETELGTPDAPVFKESLVLNKNHNGQNISMSVFGLTTPETYVKADPRHSEGIDFQDPLPALMKELAKEEHQETDYIVVLSHLGTDKSTQEKWRGDYVAEELSKDASLKDRKIIFIDGHSHSLYKDGLTFGNNVLYGQTGSQLNNVGTMRINLDDFSQSVVKTVPMKDGYNIHADMATLTPNADIVQRLDDAKTEFDDLAGYEVLGNLPIKLVGDRDPARFRETNLGNLISDSMYEYANDTFADYTDLAVMNGGGIRADINTGKVTFQDVLKVMPYGNRLVQIDVKGEQILEMFEHALSAPVQVDKETNEVILDENGMPLLSSNPGLLHTSDSVRLEFDTRLEPGSRVKKLEISNPETRSMQPLDLNKTYKLVTLEFLAVGGDGFTMLGGARQEGDNDAEVFRDYLTSTSAWTTEEWALYDDAISPYRVKVGKYAPANALEELMDLSNKVSDVILNKDKYTPETFVKVEELESELKAMLETVSTVAVHNITEEAYNTLVSKVNSVLNSLVEKGATAEVLEARETLKDLKVKVDEILTNKDKYTKETVDALVSVNTKLEAFISKMDSVNDMDDTLRAEYNTLVKDVETAFSNMKLKDDKGTTKPNTGIESANVILPVSIGLIALVAIVLLRKKKDVK